MAYYREKERRNMIGGTSCFGNYRHSNTFNTRLA
jgi:hypothetical protein